MGRDLGSAVPSEPGHGHTWTHLRHTERCAGSHNPQCQEMPETRVKQVLSYPGFGCRRTGQLMDKAKINKTPPVTWQSKHCTAQVTFGTAPSGDCLTTAQKRVKVARGSSGTSSRTTGSGIGTEVPPRNYSHSHPPPHKAERGGKSAAFAQTRALELCVERERAARINTKRL